MRLWLCRHAPVLVEPGICYGSSDVPFDESASHAAAQKIATWLPKACPVWSSPSSRALFMAHQLARLRPDLQPHVEPRIAEMHFGTWELKKWQDIPKNDIDAWVAGFTSYAPGAGENLLQLMQRVGSALDQLRLTQHADVLWLTHAGVIRAVQFLLAHGARSQPRAQDWPNEPIPYGAPLVVEVQAQTR